MHSYVKFSRKAHKKKLQTLESKDDVREYVVDDYTILYLVTGDRVVFLAIKHHRQLSFDLRGL